MKYFVVKIAMLIYCDTCQGRDTVYNSMTVAVFTDSIKAVVYKWNCNRLEPFTPSTYYYIESKIKTK